MLPSVSVLESNVTEDKIKSKYLDLLQKLDLEALKNKDNNNSREPLFFILFIIKQILRIIRILKLWLIWRIIKRIIGGEPSDNWWSSDWHYRKQITIDHTKVEGDLSNFPILVSHISSDFSNKTQQDGDDFVFTYIKGTHQIQLCHEIEYYNHIDGELVAWVNIPNLRSDEDTIFYLYYGNPTCGNQQNPESVWDSNYCGVWHLDNFLDSTMNDNDGVNHGTDDIDGKIGIAKDFTTTEKDYIDLTDLPEPADSSTYKATFEAWICPKEMISVAIINKMDNYFEPDKRSYNFHLHTNGKISFGAYSGTWYSNGRLIGAKTNDELVTSGKWQYIVAIVDLSLKNIIFYCDGKEKECTIETFGSPPNYFYDIKLNEWLGAYRSESSGTWHYDGSMDEVRISKTIRSATWISTQFNNQNNPSNFLGFGPEETKLRIIDLEQE
jgi:MSHA biogenesis protein MshQ